MIFIVMIFLFIIEAKRKNTVKTFFFQKKTRNRGVLTDLIAMLENKLLKRFKREKFSVKRAYMR